MLGVRHFAHMCSPSAVPITDALLPFRMNSKLSSIDTASGRLVTGGLGSQAEDRPPGAAAPDLPLLAARAGDRPAEPGVARRYHLHSDGPWVSLSSRGDGLVQPICAGLASIKHNGHFALSRRPRGCAAERPAGHLQYRSGCSSPAQPLSTSWRPRRCRSA